MPARDAARMNAGYEVIQIDPYVWTRRQYAAETCWMPEFLPYSFKEAVEQSR